MTKRSYKINLRRIETPQRIKLGLKVPLPEKEGTFFESWVFNIQQLHVCTLSQDYCKFEQHDRNGWDTPNIVDAINRNGILSSILSLSEI